MAGFQWTPSQPAPAPPAPTGLRRLLSHLPDWEDWLTLGLGLGAVLSVTLSLEAAGWSRNMPSLSPVGVLALLAAVLLARSPLRAPLAWLLAVVAGAAVTFWQTMEMVGPGNLEARVDAIYIRFQTWFQLAFSGGISNDSLPFNVMVIGLTWLGVFLFGWSIFRWHNAWLGLIPGGAVLFLDMALVGDSLSVAIFFYVLIGFLLVMRSNLMAQMSRWRAEGVSYPPLISLSFLHYSVWAVLLLMVAAMIAPAGPFATPKPAEALIQRIEELGVHFVRLAGPLHTSKVVPAHYYTSVLPLQGSISLGERHLLSVTLNGAPLEGPLILRGAVYDEYVSGGWKTGPRTEIEVPAGMEELIREALENGSLQGELISLTVTVETKSVVGTVLFSPGEPVWTDVPARFDVPADSLPSLALSVPPGSLSDGAGLTGERGLLESLSDGTGMPTVGMVPTSGPTLPDAVIVRPKERLAQGESYRLVGLLQTASPNELQSAGAEYPLWISAQYLQLPDSLPDRVKALARSVAGNQPTAYDRVKAIESYLRQFPVAYAIPDTPPGRDAVDYFLFESRQGYFNHHASAMVVMLRAVGVPARLTVGFIVDEADLDAGSGSYAVRDRNSYAWPEVYFPGQGWLAFNPTPDRPADLIFEPKSAETLPIPVIGNEIPFDPFDIDVPFPIEDTGFVRSDDLPTATTPGSGAGYTPWIVVAVIAIAAAVAGSLSVNWQRSVAGLPYPQQLWDKTVRLASWAGDPPEPGQTPAEYASHLQQRFRDVPDILALGAAYNRSRFGNHDPEGEEQERLQALWPHLRAALLKALLGRPWRRR